MKFIKNILELIGLLTIAAGIYGRAKFGEDYKTFKSFDPNAGEALPPELFKKAARVKDTMLTIMEKGSAGNF